MLYVYDFRDNHSGTIIKCKVNPSLERKIVILMSDIIRPKSLMLHLFSMRYIELTGTLS